MFFCQDVFFLHRLQESEGSHPQEPKNVKVVVSLVSRDESVCSWPRRRSDSGEEGARRFSFDQKLRLPVFFFLLFSSVRWRGLSCHDLVVIRFDFTC